MNSLAYLLVVLAAADPPLGKLSEKYESGGHGPATVSTGDGDPGGVSYGTYQLASKVGRADQFVKKYYPEPFRGLKAGSDAFTAKWKEVAKADAETLRKNEHEFIRETHYQPQVKKLAKELKLDVAARSPALRDVVWSSAVHHGPSTGILVTAAKSLGKPVAEASDEEFIKAIYAERGRKTADGKLAHFKDVSDRWIPALTKRFEREQKDALEMLNKK